MDENQLQLNLRLLQKEDFPAVQKLMDQVYKDMGGAWHEHTLNGLLTSFPEGQICIEDGEELVAIALTLKADYQKFSNPHTYDDLIGARQSILHNPEGDALYGLDLIVHRDYRGYRLGRRLYEARKDLCRSLNLRAILAGGRIPNYHEHSDEMKASEYIEKVKRREIYDPILSFQLSNEFQVKRLLGKYLPEDTKSEGYATLLEWNNYLYEPEHSFVESRKTQVRIGAVQWQMRRFHSVDEVLSQVEYFVDTLSDYQADFAILPEFFNGPLMGLQEHESHRDAIYYLASYTQKFREEMSRMAVSYNINIVAGSLPLIENERVYNVCYFCHRSGAVEEQRKIHITPQEKRDWVIEGGDDLVLIDSDAGKVGILICYDVEFPELARILTEKGVEILLVPFWTDTKNGYLRVRHCAMARAIENECYVAIVGSVGNLPSVDHLDVQYAQSAVFSPSDFAFPHDAVMAETTPNTEMILFSDLDLDRLKLIRNEGSVTNFKDRRLDLFDLKWKGKRILGEDS